MGLRKDNRASISFSEIGDSDLIEILSQVHYNFAGYCKELMRDGLKYRGLIQDDNKIKPIIKPMEQKLSTKTNTATIEKDKLIKHVEEKFNKF